MNIDTLRPVETCCVFFRRGFVEQSAQDATTSLQSSLDEPSRPAPAVEFLARLHTDSKRAILSRVWTLAERCHDQLQPSSFEEDFLVLSKQLLALYKEITIQISRVPAVKASTRKELFRRLEIAREYLHSGADERISLERVGREACLSPYHLHHSFVEVFKQTPHRYLTSVRLERAHSLLMGGHKVVDACISVGFSSTSAFSRLFRKHFGCPPSEVRRQREQS